MMSLIKRPETIVRNFESYFIWQFYFPVLNFVVVIWCGMSNIQDKYYPVAVASLQGLGGKNYAITGCTSGTGFYAAKAAITKRCNLLLLLNRPSERAKRADWELANYARKLGSKTRVQTVDCDLQSFQSVRSCASKVEHICKAHGGLDALLNNAGIMGQPDSRTIDGHDIQMQTNQLSHFLLTYLLMPSLEAAAAIRGESRVVQHSSGARASFTANTKSGEPSGMLEKKFFSQCDAGSLGGDGLGKWFTRDHQTKLANSVFALTLHERLKRSGSKVTSICAEPGVAATELSSNLSKGHEEHGSKPVRISSPEETFPGVQSAADGACSIVEAAFGTHVLGGDFFMPGDYVKKTVVGLPTKCMTAGVPTPKNELIKNGFRMEELTMSQKNRDLLWHYSEQATNISWKFLNRSKL